MQILDFFDFIYDEILIPVFDGIKELTITLFVYVLVIVLFLTCPIWIIPYLFIKRRKDKNNKIESGVQNEHI